MPSITLRNFAGQRSANYETQLDNSFAKLAKDVDLSDGSIKPRTGYKKVKATTDAITTIYSPPDMDGHCLDLCCFDECVSVVTAPLTQCSGQVSIAVFPQNGEPYRQILPNKERKCLYVPAPTTGPTAVVDDAGQIEAQDTRYYAYTWTDEFGIESPPSFPSNGVTLAEDGQVTLQDIEDAPDCACFLNIYRTAAPFRVGDDTNLRPNETTWQLVATVPVGATSFVDDKPLLEACLGTLMTEEDCPPPPMCKVIETELGYYVGFNGNDLYVSERHEPHNWPEYNRLKLPNQIVDAVAYYDTIFLVTTGKPYQVRMGVGGDGRAQIEPVPFTRISPACGMTLTQTPFGAAYAARDGLIGLTPSGQAVNLLDGRMSRADWRSRIPHAIVYSEGYLYGFHAQGCSFALDVSNRVSEQLEPGDFTELSIPASHAIIDNDGCVLFVNNDAVYSFGGPYREYTWESKKFITPAAVRFTAFKVESTGGPVRFRLWCGDKLVIDERVKDNKPYRLPRGPAHTEWRFRLDGYGTVYEVALATSIRELGRN